MCRWSLYYVQKAKYNSTQYRSNGDIISALDSNSKNRTTLESPQIRTGIGLVDSLRSHDVSNIKHNEILVFENI